VVNFYSACWKVRPDLFPDQPTQYPREGIWFGGRRRIKQWIRQRNVLGNNRIIEKSFMPRLSLGSFGNHGSFFFSWRLLGTGMGLGLTTTKN